MAVCAGSNLNGVEFPAVDIGVEAIARCEVLNHSFGRLSRVE
jgi:hypothetical protein